MADPGQIRDVNDAAHAISDIYDHRRQKRGTGKTQSEVPGRYSRARDSVATDSTASDDLRIIHSHDCSRMTK